MKKEFDLQFFKNIIYLKGMTPHRLALNMGIEPSNFVEGFGGKCRVV